MARFNLLSFLGAPLHRSESADSFKNVLLKLRFTARKARIVSASGPPIVPSIHEGEKPMVVSPSWLPFFLPQPSVLAPTFGGAGCGPPDKYPPYAPQWPVLFARVYFGLLDGPDSALGRQKGATKTHIPSNTRVLLIVAPSPMHRI